jgi:hypothetical protein
VSRPVLRIAAEFVMVAIAIVATYLYSTLNRESERAISIEGDHLAQAVAEKERTYQLREQALGEVDGYRACFSTFESSDGMVFSSATIPYHSSKRARTELETKLREAVEIIEREDTFDETGRKIGKKVLATFAPYDGSSMVSAAILCTSGSDFGYVRSTTLRNILEYRKDKRL